MNTKASSNCLFNYVLDDRRISGAPEDGVNKTIVRIQIKKLKELKATLELDLRSKEAELEKLKQTNATESEKSVEKELKKSLNILKGLKKKLIKLKEENGSAYGQDIDPIVKAIDKELKKNRKWKNNNQVNLQNHNVLQESAVKDKSKTEERKIETNEEEIGENQEEQKEKQSEVVENFDTTSEEKELKNKLEELEKELSLSDEEFEKRLIERLKKGKILILSLIIQKLKQIRLNQKKV